MICGVSTEHSLHASKVLGVPVRTTWNSVDLSRYQMTHAKGDYLLSVNRIDPDKGIHVFVDWVGRAGLKGDIIGDDKMIVQDPDNYPSKIRSAAGQYGIKFSGLVSHEDKIKRMEECRAVVLLPQAPHYLEVFGLAAVEANAMGKPVICTPNCGLKNVVENGVSGFFVETFDQFKEAVAKLDTISPEACRKQAEKFDIPAITPKYRDLIKRVNEGCRW
jgi:UDP-glucose:tetrahydrobiopterin glucosyltransferase